MGVVQRRVLRGLWRRLVGVGIIGPGLYGALAFIMLLLSAALFCPPWLDNAAFPCATFYVARDLGWCDHTTPGGAGTPVPEAQQQLHRVRRTGFSHRVGAF